MTHDPPPPETAAILAGFREELERLPGVACNRYYCDRSHTFGGEHRFGISLFFAPAGRHPRHLANLFVHEGTVILLKSGGIRARLEGDQRLFDLSDPESIPQVIAEVREMAGLPPGKA